MNIEHGTQSNCNVRPDYSHLTTQNNNGFWWRQYIKSLQIECSQPTAAEKVFPMRMPFWFCKPNGFFLLCPLSNCRSGKMANKSSELVFFHTKTHRNSEIHFDCSRIELHPVSMAIQWRTNLIRKKWIEKASIGNIGFGSGMR